MDNWIERNGMGLAALAFVTLLFALGSVGIAALGIMANDYRHDLADKRECRRTGGIVADSGKSWTCAKPVDRVEAP